MLKNCVMKKIAVVFSFLALSFLCVNGIWEIPVVTTYAATVENENTSEGYVEIGTAEEFVAINDNLSGNYKLTKDIVLSGKVNLPIGKDASNPFVGILDGQGHCVKGVEITNDVTGRYFGLFGYVSGEIRDLTVEGEIRTSNESKTTYVGGFCGFLSGTIKNCVNNVLVSTETTVSSSTYETPKLYLGGFAGCSTGRIENSVNNATIADSPTPIDYSEILGYIGGLVGYNENGTVYSCSNNGYVKLLDNATNGDSKVSTYYLGGIAGYSSGTVTDCKNNESVAVVNGYNRISLTYRFVGGITGYSSGTVKNSANEADLIAIGAFLYVGGVVADNSGEITVCNNIGDVNAKYLFDAKHTENRYLHYVYIAGIAGRSAGNISVSYNTGNICAEGTGTATEYTAGIAGYLSASVVNCYNIGGIEGTAPYKYYGGGIVGKASGEISKCYSMGVSGKAYGIVELSDNLTPDCYYLDYAVSGTFKRDVAVACSLEQMKQKSTFSGFDFSDVWEMGSDNSHPFPVLKKNRHEKSDKTNEFFAGGQGTIAEPFVVKTVEQLENIRLFPLSNFTIANDISFADTYNWTTIGKFDGSINGNGFSLINLSCNYSGKDYAGFIGSLNGYVCNLNIKNANYDCASVTYLGGIASDSNGKIVNCSFNGKLSSNGWVGGIAGCTSGPIIDCYNNGNIYGGDYCGGICGVLSNGNTNLAYYRGSIENSYNAGTIYRGNYCGGIVGEVSGCQIKNCYNVGTVNASDYAGGIVGRYGGSEGEDNTIENCYNNGQINAKSISGGIIGSFYTLSNNANTVVSSCYNIGSINAPACGGIWGKKNESDLDESCYYLDNVSVASSNGSSLAKKLTRSNFRDAACFAGFDFNKVWMINDSVSDCSYPRLRTNQQVGHVCGEWIKEVQATCQAAGVKGHYHCLLCEKNFDANDNILADLSIKKLNHTEVTDEAVAPTCTETGLTEGKHCSACNCVLVVQKVVPLLGHKQSEAKQENRVEATCTAGGHYDEVVYCLVCEKELSRTQKAIGVLNHTETEWIVDRAATCTEDGSKHKECSDCHKVLVTETIVARGHKLSDWTTVTEPTTKNEGKSTRFCEFCGEQEEKSIDKLQKQGCAGSVSTVGGVVATVFLLASAVFVAKKKRK